MSSYLTKKKHVAIFYVWSDGSGISRQALAREVVNDCQDAEASPVRESIRHEVQRPALIRTARQLQRCPHAQRPLTATLAHLPLPLAVAGPDAPLMNGALAGQHPFQATVTEATPLGGEFPNAEPHGGVAGTTARD